VTTTVETGQKSSWKLEVLIWLVLYQIYSVELD
jgi:antibiotic biosynthesis monooxygenase (ABM) superfamily enzyme